MRPHQLNLRHLAAHVAVAETGTIRAGSRRVHLSQPAVTQGIATLERKLGTALFVRRPTGMEPTKAGHVLALRARDMLRIIGGRLPTGTQIRAFLALARAGSYPAAAVATGLSEPSLHRAVADFAVVLGRPVVERRGRSVVLTPCGVDVARRFTLAMAEIDSALVELAGLAGREAGHMAIGAMPLSRSRLLPEAIVAFRAAHPDVAISVIEGSYAELVGLLRDGQITMMLGALRDDSAPDLTTLSLFRDVPVIVGRAGHPLAGAGPAPGAALAAYPWIVSAEGTPLRSLWARMFEALEVPAPAVPIECGSVITIRHLLAGGDYLALLSSDQVELEIAAGMLAIIGRAPGHLERTIGATTRLDWRPTPAESCFLDAVASVARGIEERFIRKS